ncbi:hypothetical protein VTK56DRAFT_8542 [Thermocarpiscus australiensis]
MAGQPLSTPKRKRIQMLNNDLPELNTTKHFTFDVHSTIDDGNASPRTRVAHRFRGLALEGGVRDSGGGRIRTSPPPPDLSMASNDMEDARQKRIKLADTEMRDADSLVVVANLADAAGETTLQLRGDRKQSRAETGSPTRLRQLPESIRFALDAAVVGQSETVANTGNTGLDPDVDSSPGAAAKDGMLFALPTPSQSPDPGKPHNRSTVRRAEVLPLGPKPKQISASDPNEPIITDALRASLTWHDDEITVYDPDDSDDDGTGINGIGFQPTPAMAYARTMRRRQQVAEYRKREESEARARRSQRRRGSPAAALAESKGKGKMQRRKVRFLDSTVEMIGA